MYTRLIGMTGLVVSCVISLSSVNAATLQEAVQQTLNSNPDIYRDASDRLARNYEIKQALGGYYPRIDLSAGIGTERAENPSTGGINRRNTLKETRIALEQMLFDGMATKREVERQMARVNSAAYRLYATSEATGLRAVEVYLETLRFQELLKLAQDNNNVHARIYNQVKRRSDSGVGRRADFDQVSGRRALTRSNVIAEEANLRDAHTNYLRVIGGMPDDSLQKPTPDSVMPANVDDTVEMALAGHPTLKSAEADVDAAVAQYKAASSTYFPRVTFNAHRTFDENVGGIDGRDESNYLGLQLRWNLFNGGSDVARRKERAHLINQAKEIRNRTHRQVVESVRLSYNSYIATNDQIDYLRRHVNSTKKTRDAYSKQFNIGQRTLLDLLDTENEYTSARAAYVNAEYDHLFAQYRVLAGTGHLLESLGVALPEEAKPLEAQRAYNPIHPRSPKFKTAELEDI